MKPYAFLSSWAEDDRCFYSVYSVAW